MVRSTNKARNKNRNGVLKLLPVQCKMARVALGWGVRELAAEAKVATDTIARLERGEELKERTIAAVRETLASAGVEFIDEGDMSEDGGPGVRLKRKRRASR